MAHWLLKTEPKTYSYADLERQGRARWDGVSNPVALKHLRAMTAGDQAFIYHTGAEKAVVGIARVVSQPYTDPKAKDPRLVVVDLEPQGRLPSPVTLAAVKADPAFAAWELVRLARLSVMPVPAELWRRILALARR
jgi:predicted RNA-binding protein with PUA-like domain